ncbi:MULTISPECIES: calcium-binding protein [Pseudosulfitobacter]|nr:calcium-binding protein [Pseudosulfitobacter pseudonitzschiae]QKS08451.1 M10 family metallopeptidase C-terminal domain-containing protein [Pseudosulfitobacter pseudonitzschiae]
MKIDGDVVANDYGVRVDSSAANTDYEYNVTLGETANVITNTSFAIYIGANATNTDLAYGAINLANAGEVTAFDRGAVLLFNANQANFSNSGTITSNSTTNYFDAAVSFAIVKNALFDNSGLIQRLHDTSGPSKDTATVSFFSSTEVVSATNSGTILSGRIAIYSDATVSETLTNSGQIVGDVELSTVVGGTLNNFGLIDGDVTTKGGNDIVSNNGMMTGVLDLGADDDAYTAIAGGVVLGGVLGGTGNDTLTGGSNADFLDGGADNDRLFGRGGDDDLRGGLGSDFMSGGMGDDQIIGDDGSDKMFGGSGDDTLNGGRDKDTIHGGDGNDEIKGGRLNDVLNGGAGADVFVYGVKQDSSTGASDVIQDYEVGIDKIDLSAVASGLTFVGTAAFSGTGNEVRYDIAGNGRTYIQVDTDANGSADMRIWLTDVGALSVDDFVL